MTTNVSIYGFLEDEVFKLPASIEVSNNTTQEFGVLYGEPANYLINKVTYKDLRNHRVEHCDGVNVKSLASSILFDGDRADVETLKVLTDEERNSVFNIIGTLIYNNKQQVETVLTDDTTVYVGYVHNTAAWSTETTKVKVILADDSIVEASLPNWVEFKFSHGNTEFLFHIWTSIRSFSANYPYTTITAVIPPYDVSVLLDPPYLMQQGNLSILANSSSFIFNKTNIETLLRDQNGIYTFTTKYVVNSNTTVQLPFAISYCGPKVPTSLECRRAIREYLEQESDATSDVLAGILPEVYIVCVFYLAPMWDVYSVRTERDVFNSIWKMKTIKEKAEKVYRDVDEEFRDDKLEILTQSQSKIMIMSLPDENNDEYFSVLEQHPTYQDYSSQVPGWKYMTELTQEFAGKLNRAMSILDGTTVSDEFIITEISGVKYLSFSAGKAEYLLMYPDSYKNLISRK